MKRLRRASTKESEFQGKTGENEPTSNPTKRGRPTRKMVTLAFLLMLLTATITGAVGLVWLGRDDPREAALSQLAWGDRVEKRLDAIIDNGRPQWAESLEDGLDRFLKKLGWS